MPRKKRRTKHEPPPPPPPEPPIDPKYRLPKRLKEWVDLNSKPKKLVIKPKKRKRTRYQKKGPMDMKHFKKWYKIQMKYLQKAYEKTLEIAYKVQYEKIKGWRRRKNRPRYIDWDRLEELATPLWFTEKYKIPLEEDYPYSPKIHPKLPAKKGKARPFIQKQIPRCFKHEIIEMDFWYEYRFPINKDALKGRANARIKKLAEPKKRPPDPHCPIPVVTEYVDPRVKMPSAKWRKHLKYLKYFAAPKNKMFPRDRRPIVNRGVRACINDLKPGIERLSRPSRRRQPLKDRELPIRVSKSAKNAKASSATKKLAKPKNVPEGCHEKRDPFKVSSAAKNASPSGRTINLAKPRPACPKPKPGSKHKCPVLSCEHEKPPWNLKKNKKGKSKFSFYCKNLKKYPCVNYVSTF